MLILLGHNSQKYAAQQAGDSWRLGRGWPQTWAMSTRTHRGLRITRAALAHRPAIVATIRNRGWRASLPGIRHVKRQVVRVLQLHRPERPGTLRPELLISRPSDGRDHALTNILSRLTPSTWQCLFAGLYKHAGSLTVWGMHAVEPTKDEPRDRQSLPRVDHVVLHSNQPIIMSLLPQSAGYATSKTHFRPPSVSVCAVHRHGS